VNWVVLVIKKSILWSKDCAFCQTNAASSSVTSIDIEKRKGFDAFVSIFQEKEGIPSRSELKIKDNCPTDPQAEVLVFDDIEPRLIVGALTSSENQAKLLRVQYPDYLFKYVRAAFSPRKDYKHWQNIDG